MTVRQFSEYVDELGAIGEDAFAQRYDDPVLLPQEEADPGDEDEGFRTEHMSMEEFRKKDPGPQGNVPPGSVHPIHKPPGKPFQDRIGVGRAPNTDVSLRLPRISKYHAFFLRPQEGEEWRIADAGSKNGTRIEGTALEPNQPVPIQDGTELQFGPYRFTFHSPEGFRRLVARQTGARPR